jgi:MEKHLA domain
MTAFPEPDENNDFLVDHVTILCSSFIHWTQRQLISRNQAPRDAARSLYFAPFAIVSHDTAPDPIFNYANRTALELFKMTWAELTTLPSRQSAEPVNQERRARLLFEVTTKGCIDDYQGVRISRTGRRFMIDRATVWNLLTPQGDYYGQAAMFGNWRYL